MAGAFTNPPGKLLLRVVWVQCWRNGCTRESFLIHHCFLPFFQLFTHSASSFSPYIGYETMIRSQHGCDVISRSLVELCRI
jgi:hypothetical protein